MSIERHLTSFPTEIREQIYECLDLKSLQTLCITCPYFAEDCWKWCCRLNADDWSSISAFSKALVRSQNLRFLSLNDSDLLASLSDVISQNRHLQELFVHYCSEVEFESALATSQSLWKLEMTECDSFGPHSLPTLFNATPNLRHVSLSGLYGENLVLDSLGSLKYLESLNLMVQSPNSLLMAGLRTELGEEPLWPHLKELSIEGVTDEALEVLCAVSPRLRLLSVVGGLSCDSVSKLLSRLVDIEILKLSKLGTLPFSTFEALCGSPPKQLITLVIQSCFLPSEHELSPVLSLIPNLKELKLIACHQDQIGRGRGNGRFLTVLEQQRQHHAM